MSDGLDSIDIETVNAINRYKTKKNNKQNNDASINTNSFAKDIGASNSFGNDVSNDQINTTKAKKKSVWLKVSRFAVQALAPVIVFAIKQKFKDSKLTTFQLNLVGGVIIALADVYSLIDIKKLLNYDRIEINKLVISLLANVVGMSAGSITKNEVELIIQTAKIAYMFSMKKIRN